MSLSSFDTNIQCEEWYNEESEDTLHLTVHHALLVNRGQYIESVPGVQDFLNDIGIQGVPAPLILAVLKNI